MKLKLTALNAKPRTEKVTLPSNLVSLFDAYITFYQTSLGIEIRSQQVIQEILSSFMQNDRDFMKHWRENLEKDATKKTK